MPRVGFFFPLLSFLSGFARETVVEDTPSRLILEVEVPEYKVEPGLGGARLTADGYYNAEKAGAPDLPWYHFQIATGARAPAVSLEPLHWAEFSLPGELAGTPRWLTPRKSEAHRDPVLFAAAGHLSPGVSEARRFRGNLLRDVAFPLGVHEAGSGRVRMLMRFRIRVDFAPVAMTRPPPGIRNWLDWAGVKNPRGGQYQSPVPRRGALRKAARSAYALGDVLLKIRVGDRQLDGLAEDGVYALTFAQVSATIGSGVRFSDLRMYAGLKDTLSVRWDSSRAMSPNLREIPIEVRDHDPLNPSLTNGTFDNGDTILFYAHGTSIWNPIPAATGPIRWNFTSDPYSFENFYYLDWSGTVGTPLRLAVDSTVLGGPEFTSAPHYLRAERDQATGSCDPSGVVDGETGYEWYWHWKGNACSVDNAGLGLSSGQIRSATTDSLPGDTGDSLWLGAFVFLDLDRSFAVWMGGDSLASANIGPGIPGDWSVQGPAARNARLELDSLVWGGGNQRFEGYTVRHTRSLAWRGGDRLVFPAATGRRVAYRVQGGAGIRCLRVEKGVGRKWLRVFTQAGDGVFSDSAGNNEDVQYFLLRDVNMTPQSISAENVGGGLPPLGAVETMRDLVTGDGVDPEYLVIAPDALLAEALAMANYRDTLSYPPLDAAVVRTEDIYREWSGGRISPTAIRDLLRWALWNWGSRGGTGRLKYVLLYGDGHYDYRNLRNLANPLPQHVPAFNWSDKENYNPMNTDDFFAVLDTGEVWSDWEIRPLLDVALSRLPVQTREQARSYLDKLRAYENPANGGEWRGRVVLTADDATQRGRPGDWDPVPGHTNQTEDLAGMIARSEPGIRLEKVYLLDYTHNTSYLKPEATQDLMDHLNRGTLLVSYMGHGAYNQWADEVLVKTNDALSRMRNAGKAFLVMVLSCTVGRFDKLSDEGMMEQFVKQKDFGAIVALGGSRETYPGQNGALGLELLKRLFPGDTMAAVPGVGVALQQAKNAMGRTDNSYNLQKYILFGDPATVIRRPRLAISLDRQPDTLRALGCDTLRGRVEGGTGRGFVNVRVVSGDVRKVFPVPNGPQTEMKRGQILFERTVEYRNDSFTVDYFLPKQVPFGDSTAKIQFFAWDSVQGKENSHAVLNLSIQGADTAGACVQDRDKRGPRIAVTGCNVKESGEVDFPDRVRLSLPFCLQIEATDTVGGVMSGDGPDEGTTVELTGVREPYHPQPGEDGLFRKTYQLAVQRGEASLGPHLLNVTARDGFGNLSRRQVVIEVAGDSALNFVRAFNAPNPVKNGGTTFYFSTLLPSDEGAALTEPLTDRVRFDLRIFDQGGRMVRRYPDARSGETRWDGTDAWGHSLANGVYFYSVTATTEWTADLGGSAQKISKRNILVLSR